MAKTIDGYPQPSGARMESVIEKAGPASYVAVTPGVPPTGGQALQATEFGLKYLDQVTAGLDDEGQYLVFFSPGVAGNQSVASGILLWMTAANGIEVGGGTDLSGHKIRLRAIGLD